MPPLSLTLLPATKKVGRSPKVPYLKESWRAPTNILLFPATQPNTRYSFAEMFHKAQLMLATTYVSKTSSSDHLHTSRRLVAAPCSGWVTDGQIKYHRLILRSHRASMPASAIHFGHVLHRLGCFDPLSYKDVPRPS